MAGSSGMEEGLDDVEGVLGMYGLPKVGVFADCHF